MNLSPLGVFHTILSLLAVAAAIAALSNGDGMCSTQKDQVNADLLAFFKA